MTDDEETVKICIENINPASLDYDEWLAVGMVCKDAGIGFHEWDRWSANDRNRYSAKEMPAKWASFKGNGMGKVGIGSIVKMAEDQGFKMPRSPKEDREIEWNAILDPGESARIVRTEWLQAAPLPEPGAEWDGKSDFVNYLKAVFESEDKVGIVADSFEVDGKIMPKRGVWGRTAGELIEVANKARDLSFVIGDWNEKAGAWIRFNPLDGQGCSDANVTSYRFALVESDDISIELQHAIYKQLELPIAALVHSGGKSLHAIVRIEATDFKEYQKRVDFLYEVCKKNGLAIDRKNRNPSRLSRLPGATRNGNPQRLVAVNIGHSSWAEWSEWISAQNDDLPEVENAEKGVREPPELANTLIDGVLRKGHKMLMSGPSKAGKSFLLMQLAVAIANGGKWLGWNCAKGRVLYVNLELDAASCYHRLNGIYKATGDDMNSAKNIDIWNLRGKAMPMTELAPRLIRRAEKVDRSGKGKYSAVIIDPIYKVITGDENAADQMAKFCNQFDRVCAKLETSVIYCHHHSKGDQGQKRASDRASGSGVFARDPDALVDLIELEVTDAIRTQYVNRTVCDCMAHELDFEAPGWKDDAPQDDLLVADKFFKWAEANGHGDVLREPRAIAQDHAAHASAWRIEGILREFRTFDPIFIWFDYPTHKLDEKGILSDAKAAGELPERRTQAEAVEAKKEEKRAQYESMFDSIQSLNPDEPTTTAALAEALAISERAVRKWITDNAKETVLRTKNGVVYKKKEPRNQTS